MSLDLALDAPLIRRGFDAETADPATWFRFCVPRVRDALAMFTAKNPIDELLLRGPNKSGKTYQVSMFVVECAKKSATLDGVRLPQWKGRVECLQLVIDYPQQLLSIKAAYERAIGNWPHHPVVRDGILKSILVMPRGGDPNDRSGWSVIYFQSLKNLQTGVGARADIVHFDEPPPMDALDELRKASHIGRRGLILIGMTPIKRRQWQAIRDNYGETHRRTIRRVDEDRAEVRWSFDEVEDWVFSSADEKAKILRKHRASKRPGAREHGDYENIEGSCPFDSGELQGVIAQMIKAWCRSPMLRRVPIVVESEDGAKESGHIMVEVWAPPRKGLNCYQNIDPASGIDDGKHNPLGLHLSDEDTGDLYARWNGYVAPNSLGSAAAALGRYYGQTDPHTGDFTGTATDIEMKDHWGVNVLLGYQAAGGDHLCYETRELRPDVFTREAGYDVTANTKAIWIGCIQEWIAAFKAGHPYAICRSREVFNYLLDMELDMDDKVIDNSEGPNHAEDVWLLGQKLRRLNRPSREADDYRPDDEPLMPEAEIMRRVMKADRPGRSRKLLAGSRPRL